MFKLGEKRKVVSSLAQVQHTSDSCGEQVILFAWWRTLASLALSLTRRQHTMYKCKDALNMRPVNSLQYPGDDIEAVELYQKVQTLVDLSVHFVHMIRRALCLSL